jgi:iron complex outermembrane receptor protein
MNSAGDIMRMTPRKTFLTDSGLATASGVAQEKEELAMTRSGPCLHGQVSRWTRRRMRSHSGLRALCAASLLALAPLADAETIAALSEDLFLAKMPVVLSATRLRQPLSESPAAITVIDRQMIEASGALTIPDLLRLVPGFQVGHVYGHRSTVTYHGLSDSFARRMQVLVDGRSVYTPAFGGVPWTDIPLAIEDIDRIEVIRGPNGVTYGANSFSAVINIITRLPTQDAGTYVSHARDRDLDMRRTVARYAGGDDAFRYRLTAGRYEDSGSSSPRFPDDQRSTFFTFRGDYRTGMRDSYDIQIGHLGGPRDGGDVNDPLDIPHEQRVVANYQQFRFRRIVDTENELSVQFYRQYHRLSETYPVTVVVSPFSFAATINEDLKTERYDLELQHTFRASPGVRVVWGGETRLDRLTAPGYFATPETIDSRLYRLFGNVEWRPAPDWIANLGLMYEDNSFTSGDVSPRVALNHHLDPDHTLRAAYSRAWRTPSFAEERSDWRPCTDNGLICNQVFKATTDLAPERIDAYELGYLGAFSDRTLAVDIKLFQERIRDVIAAYSEQGNPADHFYTFANDGHADIRGWETQLEWRPRDGTRLYLAHAYARQRGRMLYRSPPTEYLETYKSTPVHTTSALAIQRLPSGFEVSAAWYRMTNMLWLDQGGSDDETGKRTNLDLRLAYHLRKGGVRGTAEIVGQNVHGSYYDYQDDTLVDRRYYVRLSLELR